MIIGATPGYECTDRFFSAEEALRAISTAPDVLLLDIHLPGMLGSEAVRVFREKYPSLQVLMLTVYDGQDKVFESICNGACGYLLKKTPPAKLLEATRSTEGGPHVAGSRDHHALSADQPAGKAGRAAHSSGIRLLKLLSEGYSYQNSAGQLNISINTVRLHPQHLRSSTSAPSLKPSASVAPSRFNKRDALGLASRCYGGASAG